MNLKTWLKAQRGRSAALAAHLNLSRGRVTQMADDGVPPGLMFKVRDFTGGEVSVEAMVADRTPIAASLPATEGM